MLQMESLHKRQAAYQYHKDPLRTAVEVARGNTGKQHSGTFVKSLKHLLRTAADSRDKSMKRRQG
jgi:hypothetical protein